MTDIHWSDAEIERQWDELASGVVGDPPPSGEGRQALRQLYQWTHAAPPAHARHAVDRIVRPLMEPGSIRPPLDGGIPGLVSSVSLNGAHQISRSAANHDHPTFLRRHRSVAISLVAALLLLFGGGGFYLLSVRSETEPPAIPAAVYQQPSATPQSASLASLVWESNGVADPILEPNDVTIAPDGNVWVADGITSNFKIFDRDGTLLETWGETGKDPGQFNFNSFDSDGAAAFDADGNLYVADTGNFRIQKFDEDRAFVTSWGTLGEADGQFQAAVDIEVDHLDRVFVADLYGNSIQVFDSNGVFLFRFGREGNAEGEFVQPTDLAIDPDGRVWVADSGNNRIQVFDANGTFQAAFGSFGSEDGQMKLPHGIDIDGMGNVYIAELYGYRVQMLNRDGESLGSFGNWGTAGDGFNTLEDIAVDDEGGMYVSDIVAGRVQKFQLAVLPETLSGT